MPGERAALGAVAAERAPPEACDFGAGLDDQYDRLRGERPVPETGRGPVPRRGPGRQPDPSKHRARGDGGGSEPALELGFAKRGR